MHTFCASEKGMHSVQVDLATASISVSLNQLLGRSCLLDKILSLTVRGNIAIDNIFYVKFMVEKRAF